MEMRMEDRTTKESLEFLIKNPMEFDFYNSTDKIKTIKIGVKKCLIGYKIYERQQRLTFNKIGGLDSPKKSSLRFYNEEKLISSYVQLYKRINKLREENILKVLK